MKQTTRGNRLHISIFGKRNTGKSTLMNALTNQDISVVSNIKGTTTDPVYKSMELLPIGPVVFVDTAGIDDGGELGEIRVEKTRNILNKTDIGIYVLDVTEELDSFDREFLNLMREQRIPLLGVMNKIDRETFYEDKLKKLENEWKIPFVGVSALEGNGVNQLKKQLIEQSGKEKNTRVIIGDLLKPRDIVVLVTPIDKAAPKGRLILPQQQTIRDIIDHDAIAVVTKESELSHTLETLGDKVKMVVTDAQAFAKVNEITPDHIPLTSFSILFARYKGELKDLVLGIKQVKKLKKQGKVLICEACSHHRQDGDIGKEKIPRMLEKISKNKLDFKWYSGTQFPTDEEIQQADLIVHCGGCMINQKEMQHRLFQATKHKTPIVNYGVFLAYASGVLTRSLEPFSDLSALLKDVSEVKS